MTKITIAETDTYELVYDNFERTIRLIENEHKEVLTAYFFHETSDDVAILSGFNTEDKSLAELVTTMVNSYLKQIKPKFKLFCFPPSAYQAVFFENNRKYKLNETDNIMIRHKFTATQNAEVKISKFNICILNEASEDIIQQITQLLRNHSHWAQDVDIDGIEDDLEFSECIYATNADEKVVGIVEFFSNSEIAYISDVVVAEEYRGQHIGRDLLVAACNLIDEQEHEFTFLLNVAQGSSQEAATKMYTKFGFVNYTPGATFKICYTCESTPSRATSPFYTPAPTEYRAIHPIVDTDEGDKIGYTI